MGLQVSKELNNGLFLNGLYARIDSIMGYKKWLDFSVNYYVSRDAFLANKPYLQQEMYGFIPSIEKGSENFIRQAYFHLKTLNQFQGAVDVYEEGQQ